MKKVLILFTVFVLPPVAILFFASGNHQFKELPYYGEGEIVDTVMNGKTITDTIPYTIGDFVFTDQDGQKVTREDLRGRIFVVNFFFTSCPTICPPMSAQLMRVQMGLKDVPDFAVLSHTVDPRNDSLPVLRQYAEKYGANTKRWMFLRGSEKYTYKIGEENYYLTSEINAGAPGGFIHSPMLVLIDQKGHIRGYYDGTNTDEVDQLMEGVRRLYKEDIVATKREMEKRK